MAFFSRTPLCIERLRLPFAVRVEVRRGSACLRDFNARRVVRAGDPFVVPPFSHFDCELAATPRSPCEMTLTAVADAECRRPMSALPARYWSRSLAAQVFAQPALDWNAMAVAERWEVTPRLVRSRLFAEGEALQALVREQRAAYAMYVLGAGFASAPVADGEVLAKRAGLRSQAALARLCVMLFGVEPDELAAPATVACARTGLWPVAA